MPINIANYFEADRRSAKAGETLDMGMVVKVSDWGNGERKLLKVTSSGDLVAENYAVVYKVSAEPYQVTTSTVASQFGSRITTISSGDSVVEVRRGAIIEYSADLLDASLDPARGGVTPKVTDALGVVNARFCAASAGSAINTPMIANVFRVFGTKVLIELK